MISDSREDGYGEKKERVSGPRRVLGLGALAAASAFAGGLAVAWWHRRTLEKLQNPIPLDETSATEFPDSERNMDGI